MERAQGGHREPSRGTPLLVRSFYLRYLSLSLCLFSLPLVSLSLSFVLNSHVASFSDW